MFQASSHKVVRAHRFAWELEVGPIPEGMSVLHRCDNTRCVRAPDHLFLGTQADNMRDMRAKGRFVPAIGPRKTYHGEAHPASKVTESDVREIRRLRAEGRTLQHIGDRFGLKTNSVHYICVRKTWKHVL